MSGGYHEGCPCLCCIVPPHMLEKVAKAGHPRAAAAATATLTDSLRLQQTRTAFRPSVALGATPIRTTLDRAIFTANSTHELPGDLLATEGQSLPDDDVAANEAYEYSGITWNFFHDVFGRQSIDNLGMRLTSTVHYGVDYDNAFWNNFQMVYGDGDGDIFRPFTASLDVIAHELTHGVTQYTAELIYRDQSGALNESFSDVMGSLVKQWHLGQTADQADWLIGSELFDPAAGVQGEAIRSLKAPGSAYNDPRLGKDPQPGKMSDYHPTSADNGGVHINSGIPNHAFYLAASAIGGHAWEIAGRIWYLTLKERLRADADFRKCAFETISVARDYYASEPSIARKVAQAWVQVEVLTAQDLAAIGLEGTNG